MRHIIINGKFLSQPVTGVQRFAREILAELDKLDSSAEIIVAVNKNAGSIPEMRNIRIERVGKLTGNLWEQISLPLFVMANKGICVNLCGIMPVLTPHIAVIHDVSFKVNKAFFSRKFSLWYRFVYALSVKRIKKIITVSEFSRDEISREYRLPKEKITVAYDGWQHLARVRADSGVLDKFGLREKEFYFSLSSLAPNKNFRWIAENAAKNPNVKYAVGGAINQKVFGDIFDFAVPVNVLFLGYLTDGEAKALMCGCRAFLFPTFYEGFGIPPLEALSVGAKTVVSDASCMREIFGNCVYYVNPHDSSVDLEKLILKRTEVFETVGRKYNWKKSADIVYGQIKDYLKNPRG